MLYFPCPLTPAATEVFECALEIAADLAQDDALGGEWAVAYPLSATCFTPEPAREALLDLLEKLRLPQVYAPTSYHWLLMYECLYFQIECFNDDPSLILTERFKASVDAQDAAYLCFSLHSEGREELWIDFDAFIDIYFWDTDFLLDPTTFYQLGAAAKQALGYRADLFSVLSGLTPHPTELVLKRVDAFEPTEPEGEEANEEFDEQG